MGLEPHWHQDLCRRYGVSPARALELGTRRRHRRPTLPGSATCQSVQGQTWEDLWGARPRDSEEAVWSFYREIGAWLVFRQSVYHRWRNWAFLARHLPAEGTLLEYGAGIAPATWWILTHWPHLGRCFALADVPSEHWLFGLERAERLARDRIRPVPIQPGGLPEVPPADVTVLLEVLEHVLDPVAVIEHTGRATKQGGVLFESFAPTDAPDSGDWTSAQLARPMVYTFLEDAFIGETGRPWTDPDGGGIRRWRKR